MKKKMPSIVTILIVTLLTIVMWIAVEVYISFKETPEIKVPDEILREFTPTIDQKTFDEIIGREAVRSSNFIVVSTPTASPQPEITPIPEATPTLEPDILPTEIPQTI